MTRSTGRIGAMLACALRRLGQAIVDPDTGESLGGEEEVVGVVEIVKIIGEKLSQARTVQGGGFKVGDRAVMK